MNSAWTALSKNTKFITKSSYITLILICFFMAPAAKASVTCEGEFSLFKPIQSAEDMLYAIQRNSDASPGFSAKEVMVKEPQFAYQIHSANPEDYDPNIEIIIFKHVREKLGEEKFRQELKNNVGSYIVLSSGQSPMTPDFYIASKADLNKYDVVQTEDIMEDKPLSGANYTHWLIAGLLDTPESKKFMVGLKNDVPKVFYRASGLGYTLAQKVSFETPWGSVEVKNSGDDIWLIVNEDGEPYVGEISKTRVSGFEFQLPKDHAPIDNTDVKIQSRGDMLNRIVKRLQEGEPYFKVPYLGYKIWSTNIQDYPQLIQDSIIAKLGQVDNTQYTDYLQQNLGSAFSIQFKKDGSPDFYIIGKDDYNSEGYKKISPLEVERDNKKLVDTFRSNPEFAELFDAQDENLVGILKTEEIKLFRMSDLGYSIDELVSIMPEWSWPQDKPAGQDAWLVINENGNPYMVNADLSEDEEFDRDTTLPINYVPAN